MLTVEVLRECGPDEDEPELGPATVMGVNSAISHHPADTPTTHQLNNDGAGERKPGAGLSVSITGEPNIEV